MIKALKFLLLFLTAVMLVFFVSACGQSDDSSASVPEISELKAEIIGQWGRQSETMHYFNKDMSCIVGGMQGTYDIDGSGALVLTTMSGSVTRYEWADSSQKAQSENYWSMKDSTIKVNGNAFIKISDSDYLDEMQTPDNAG